MNTLEIVLLTIGLTLLGVIIGEIVGNYAIGDKVKDLFNLLVHGAQAKEQAAIQRLHARAASIEAKIKKVL